ncbi:MAG: toprim domain-containing protein [Candidatus Vogelbacteria bacterium]|nr:toprim domain-containing protein [Candidatus Vogelbacteria bacterium]
MHDDIISKLTEIFVRFPGIGPKQARRFVYFLLAQPQGSLQNFAKLIAELKTDIVQCERCTRFFILGVKRFPLCDLCADPNRDNSLLMIVEKDIDLNNIRKLGVYNGQYAVLGGLVPILEKNLEGRIRQTALVKNIEHRLAEHSLKEIIVALSVTREGDNTVDYLKVLLQPYETKGVKISIFGRGLSSGTEIEYTDSDTIKNALLNRH